MGSCNFDARLKKNMFGLHLLKVVPEIICLPIQIIQSAQQWRQSFTVTINDLSLIDLRFGQ